MSVVCLYDAKELDEDVLAAMRRTHPVVRGQQSNDAYEPGLTETLFSAPLSDPPADAVSREVERNQLAALREFVRENAGRHGLALDRLEDLVLAANEVVSNSLQHGGGRCSISVWDADGSVVCEVRDRGLIVDPLVGRLAPSPNAPAGRGLWLANHLCDLVQIRSSQAGTAVRLHIDR
jgi:anti-sigma regulatory factor (Ser/Thr protein kinase)